MSRAVNEVKVLKTSEMLGLQAADPKPGKKYPAVAKVKPDSPAMDKFVVGDQIISVNGVSMDGQPYSAVHQQVRDTKIGNNVVFMIKPAQGMVIMGFVGRSLSSLSLDSSSSLNSNISPTPKSRESTGTIISEKEEYGGTAVSPDLDDSLDGIDLGAFGSRDQRQESFAEPPLNDNSSAVSLEGLQQQQENGNPIEDDESYIDLKEEC
eukprot:m.258978 g.258978  ORF g.258978 m.258978 type:complete len:208 (+) comp37395_c0_seq1:137-760(+)